MMIRVSYKFPTHRKKRLFFTHVLFLISQFFSREKKEKEEEERLVAPILKKRKIDIHQISHLRIRKRKGEREETYLNWFGSARWRYPRKMERLDRWQFCDLLFSAGSEDSSQLPKKLVVENLSAFQRWQKTRAWFGSPRVFEIAFVACASTNSSSSPSRWIAWLKIASRTLWMRWFLFWRKCAHKAEKNAGWIFGKGAVLAWALSQRWHVGREILLFFGADPKKQTTVSLGARL